jgi:hypothetical protein
MWARVGVEGVGGCKGDGGSEMKRSSLARSWIGIDPSSHLWIFCILHADVAIKSLIRVTWGGGGVVLGGRGMCRGAEDQPYKCATYPLF